ncbi:hypothetical protein SAMN05428976_11337 [Clostridium sp. USBA 49]|uniref:hypothetical protein n=1 Tax=Clostridium sp. USBA 49 TaxID=1881060 RepID=UPI000999121F|nr:hypothetical protein [Clostridium sp. USBA 49]SKA89641.1 hypothetical protein SAMN05428976_11337 [Clostridium sp. USBA 49]
MEKENKVIESIEVAKEIFNRLNNINSNFYLVDNYDNSRIVVDNELLEIIKRYYRSKLEVDYGKGIC